MCIHQQPIFILHRTCLAQLRRLSNSAPGPQNLATPTKERASPEQARAFQVVSRFSSSVPRDPDDLPRSPSHRRFRASGSYMTRRLSCPPRRRSPYTVALTADTDRLSRRPPAPGSSGVVILGKFRSRPEASPRLLPSSPVSESIRSLPQGCGWCIKCNHAIIHCIRIGDWSSGHGSIPYKGRAAPRSYNQRPNGRY
jgi:hypothetical protein